MVVTPLIKMAHAQPTLKYGFSFTIDAQEIKCLAKKYLELMTSLQTNTFHIIWAQIKDMQ